MTDDIFPSLEKLFMHEAIKLAKKGLGWTYPNPMVGGVLVKNGKIIGHGYHQKAGKDHAEIVALKSVKESVKSSTLYVNLEPCSHYGRTPPCVEAIIKSGISRVVCSTADPNPKINGKGIKILQNAGINVEVGFLETEAKNLNEAFFTYHEKKRPFIALKFAASLDGKIATRKGESKWITNTRARKFTMNSLWSAYQSVLVGINTVIKDNEPMRIIDKRYKNPLRIVLDSWLRIPIESKIFWDKNIIIATTQKANPQKKKKLQNRGINIIEFEGKEVPLNDLMNELYKRQIISVLVEGGGKTLGSFVDERLVDKVYAFYSPILIGGEEAISAVRGNGVEKIAGAIRLKKVSFKKLASDFLITGYTS